MKDATHFCPLTAQLYKPDPEEPLNWLKWGAVDQKWLPVGSLQAGKLQLLVEGTVPSGATHIDRHGFLYKRNASPELKGRWLRWDREFGDWFVLKSPIPSLQPLAPDPTPPGATHYDVAGRYYRPDIFTGDWLRWDTGRWVYPGKVPEGFLTSLLAPVKPKCTCGRRTPFSHSHATDCPVYSHDSKGVCGKKAKALILDYIGNKPDANDELGKVWDVLHAARINGTGDLSAAEGVQLLVDRINQARKLIHDASISLANRANCGANEQPRADMLKWLDQ
jgi:hypothetical protein